MQSLLLATHNKAKLEELKKGTEQVFNEKVKVLSLDDLGIKNDPEETGQTFEQNAILKAKFYADISQLVTIADDGGLIIPALNNEPGVKSRRWLGYEATDEELIAYTLKRLQGFPKEKRVAYLEVSLCFYDPKTFKSFCVSERNKGRIAEKAVKKPTDGYPFRGLFIIDKFDRYYDELTETEHETVNHRRRALKKLLKLVEEYLIE